MLNRIRPTWVLVLVSVVAAACAAPAADSVGQGSTTTVPVTSTAPTTTAVVPTTVPAPVGSSSTLPVAPGDEVVEMWSNGLIAVASDGSYAFTSVIDGRVLEPGRYAATYDAQSLTSYAVSYDNSGTVHATIWEGKIPSGPDFPDPFLESLFADQAALVQGMDTYGSEPISAPGRRPSIRTTDPRDGSEVIVDTASLLPAAYLRDRDGETLRSYEIAGAAVNRSALAIVDGYSPVTVDGGDAGFRLVDLADVGNLAGYQPLVPSWMPPGFELSQVAFAPSPISAIPDTRNVTVLVYHDRTAQITITMRDAGTQQDWTDDPWDEGLEDADVPGLFTHGDFFIAPVHMWETHAWGLVGDVFVTVSGAASTSDLEEIADSLG